jgi:hypothetical protein
MVVVAPTARSQPADPLFIDCFRTLLIKAATPSFLMMRTIELRVFMTSGALSTAQS